MASPASIGTLRFANEAYTGEMCILFGTTAARLPGHARNRLRTGPDFAAVV